MTKEQQFEQLFHESYSDICRYFARRVEHHAAQELAGEVFVIAWRRFDEVSGEILPWLYTVARNLLMNHRRSVVRQQALVERVGSLGHSTSESTLDILLARGLSQHAVAALAKLSEQEREALFLTCIEQVDSQAAAKIMGCSATAFRARLSRARRKLVKFFDQTPNGVSSEDIESLGLKDNQSGVADV